MHSMMKRGVARMIDPLLLKIGSKIRHLEALQATENGSTRFSYSALIDEHAVIYPEARIVNFGMPTDISIGSYSCIRGQLGVNMAGGRIKIGRHCFVGPGSCIWSIKSIEIGNFVLISHMVDIHDNDGHSQNADVRRNDPITLFERKRPFDSKAWQQLRFGSRTTSGSALRARL